MSTTEQEKPSCDEAFDSSGDEGRAARSKDDEAMTMTMTILIAAALIAAYTDVRTRRIPNWLTVGMVIYGVLHFLHRAGWHGLLLSLGGLALGAGLILVPMLIPFAKRGLGAGDVKFLAAVGSIVGAQGVILVFALASGVGALLSAVALRRQRIKVGRPVSIPYGVALSFGTLVVTVGSLVIGR